MEANFTSDSLKLSGYLAQPLRADGTPRRTPRNAVILCHGFPAAPGSARKAGTSYHVLADRFVEDMGWTAFVPNYRGCGRSEGNFSLPGWLDDISAAVDYVCTATPVTGVWVAGFGTGASLGLVAAADLSQVGGAVSVAARADFVDWEANAEGLLTHSREVGVISDDDFPADFDEWAGGLGGISAAAAANRLAPRPLLVVHGADDELVPPIDARVIADAHGAADLRVLNAGSHRLRYDPRCISLVLGWLDRRGHDAVPTESKSASTGEDDAPAGI